MNCFFFDRDIGLTSRQDGGLRVKSQVCHQLVMGISNFVMSINNFVMGISNFVLGISNFVIDISNFVMSINKVVIEFLM